jgi:heme-degrading monooxygenase HmoA
MPDNANHTIVTLTIARYPGWAVPIAFVAMVLFRIPLFFRKKLLFWRLMGSGKNGTFDKIPDLKQWAIMGVFAGEQSSAFQENSDHATVLHSAYGAFIAGWLKLFCRESHTFLLQPIESHGNWNGRKVFGDLPKNSEYEGQIAVMTRATIRLSKLNRFWAHVPDAAHEMANAEGFITSYGVGEWPWIKQATFSIWENKAAMRKFAYQSPYHKEVIRKTHAENWYSEEMFTRFKVVTKF